MPWPAESPHLDDHAVDDGLAVGQREGGDDDGADIELLERGEEDAFGPMLAASAPNEVPRLDSDYRTTRQG